MDSFTLDHQVNVDGESLRSLIAEEVRKRRSEKGRVSKKVICKLQSNISTRNAMEVDVTKCEIQELPCVQCLSRVLY